jgi:Ca2+:H+ antiporter
MGRIPISILLLIFVPLSVAAGWLHWDDTAIFITSTLAIIPLSLWLTTATEKIAVVTGPTVGGLVNAIFGSATVLIIALMALRQGLIEIVEASITGSILNALLLLLGLGMFAGGLRYKEQHFQPILAKVNGSSMTLAVIAIALPTIAFATSNIADEAVHDISIIVSALLMVVYGLTLLFSLKTHSYLYEVGLVGEGVATDLVVHPKETLPADERPNLWAWIIILLASTMAITVVSDLFVGVIESETQQLGLTTSFTGVILLPLISDVATCIMVTRLALANKMDLAVATATGDSLLVALFVAPILVLVGHLIGQPIDLNLMPFEVIALAITVTVVNLITFSGRSNWLDGTLLLATYIILAVAFYFTS